MISNTGNEQSEDHEHAAQETANNFNGGKMIHIFEFDTTSHLYLPRVASEAAEEALKNGRLFYKIDGSNGMIMKNFCDGDDENDSNTNLLVAFQRLDTRGRTIPAHCVQLPNGQNSKVYEGHSYCYEPISIDVPGKKQKKRNQAMLSLVQNHSDYFLSLMNKRGDNCVSIEWVGTKFNRTPGVPPDVAIAVHSEQVCEVTVDRNYEGMKSFLLDCDTIIEGLVIEYCGNYWKVRADCFDKKCTFKTNNSSARAPKYLC